MTRLLLDDKPLIILPSLAVNIGLNEAIIVQQLHYWLLESKNIQDDEKWVYNTYDEWAEQFPFWSVATIRRTISKLEKSGLVITGNYNKLKIDNTKWYRLDYEKLEHMSRPPAQNEQTDVTCVLSDQNEQTTCSKRANDLINLNRPLPEITTENTTENIPVGEQAPKIDNILVPQLQKSTALIFLTIGGKPELSEDDKTCLNMLFKIHTPAAINEEIQKAFKRLEKNGSVKVEFEGKDYIIKDSSKLPIRYIYNSMKNWSSLKGTRGGTGNGKARGQNKGNPNRQNKDYAKGAGPGFFAE